MLRIPVTIDEWVERLQDKTLDWLLKQTQIAGNGSNHDTAVKIVIRRKREDGEQPERTRVCYAHVRHDADMADCVIEHVPSGPRGQTERVVVPRSIFSG